MEQRPIASVPRRILNGAFHDYVRGVFAGQSVREHAVRTRRTRWLNGFAQHPSSSAAQRWENEGGTSPK
jgi:hypothetical protein